MEQHPPARLPGRNDDCWCGSGKKYKKCHMTYDQAGPPQGPEAPTPWMVRQSAHLVKTPEQIAGIRLAGRLTASILDMLTERVQPGITTEQIDQWVHETTVQAGGRPGPLNYKGYPKSVCTSINEVVCHGIPGPRVLQSGDIVNIDVTSELKGYFGDASRMYLVGEVSEPARRLVRVTRECLEAGIAQVRPGAHLGDIGHAIQSHAEKHGYSVVRDFVGHGVGLKMHEEPQVPHYGKRGRGLLLEPGMVFTIEPMINEGDWRIRILEDQWTAVTVDGKLSAQWEHTVTVTDSGVEILTL